MRGDEYLKRQILSESADKVILEFIALYHLNSLAACEKSSP